MLSNECHVLSGFGYPLGCRYTRLISVPMSVLKVARNTNFAPLTSDCIGIACTETGRIVSVLYRQPKPVYIDLFVMPCHNPIFFVTPTAILRKKILIYSLGYCLPPLRKKIPIYYLDYCPLPPFKSLVVIDRVSITPSHAQSNNKRIPSNRL